MFYNRLDKILDVLLEHIKHPHNTQYIPLDDSVINMFLLKDIAAIRDIEKNLQNYKYKLKIVRIVKINFNLVLYTNIMLILFYSFYAFNWWNKFEKLYQKSIFKINYK